MGTLSHLDELEAEAIYIIREVAAECEKPVMLYSIGKDSSVMLHLAMKAFYPEKPPFPFMHIDTTWKFKDMIKFRDDTAKKLGIEMIVYSNEEGIKQGINPFDHGSAYTDIMKTQALKQANETVFSLAGRQPEFRGMGTTLVAALIQGDCATVINVGDSRAYRFDGEAMHQISEDHSYVEEMRRRGKITEADARTHPQKNLITRAVGVEPCVEGDLFEVRLNEKDMLLLCSDGLTGMAEDSRIAEVLANAPTLELAGDALLQLALDGGGRDNITVALFTLGKKQGA